MKEQVLETVKQSLRESIETKERILTSDTLVDTIAGVALDIVRCLKDGHKLLICGNGGSASDSLHFAGEILGRFVTERNSLPAIALNADVATMTAIANDYGYEFVFSRQVEGLMQNGDILFGISTSGNSRNIINAVNKAHEKGNETICLSGRDGGQLKNICTKTVVVPSNVTARIQESHICIIHIICNIVDQHFDEIAQ